MAQVTRKVLSKLDENFESRVAALRNAAKDNADAERNIKQLIFEEFGTIDRFNPDTIHRLFDRSEISSKYVDVHTNSGGKTGTVKEGIVLKLQHDWLGALERDMHLRKRTRVRLAAHAAARTRGIGHDDGPVNNGIIRYLSILLALEP